MRLTEDCVLPSQYYQPLRELLMESVLGPAEVGASLGVCVGGIWVMATPCFRDV